MFELEKCMKISVSLRKIEEEILELKERGAHPRVQTITGMPKASGGFGNCFDSYIIELERLENTRNKLTNARHELWVEACNKFKQTHTKEEDIQLMQYRFYEGRSWRVSCELMSKKYPDGGWKINKCFRVYRKILNKQKKCCKKSSHVVKCI